MSSLPPPDFLFTVQSPANDSKRLTNTRMGLNRQPVSPSAPMNSVSPTWTSVNPPYMFSPNDTHHPPFSNGTPLYRGSSVRDGDNSLYNGGNPSPLLHESYSQVPPRYTPSPSGSSASLSPYPSPYPCSDHGSDYSPSPSPTGDPHLNCYYPNTTFPATQLNSSCWSAETIATPRVSEAAQRRRLREAKFSCDRCGQTFTARHNLENHNNSHDGIRKFPCENCQRAFGTAQVLKRHIPRCKGFEGQ